MPFENCVANELLFYFQPDDRYCLRNLKILSVEVNTLSFFGRLKKVAKMFPSLTEVHLKAGRIAKLRQLGNLLLWVTRLEGSRCVPNPFKILNLLQNATTVHLECKHRRRLASKYFPEFDLSTEMPPSFALVELKLIFPRKSLRFQEFLRLFSGFPNLTKMTCNFYGIQDFNEKAFCQFLAKVPGCYNNLKQLQFSFQRPVPGMTAQSVLTLLNQSRLEQFSNLFCVQFSVKDFSSLTNLAKRKGMLISTSYPIDETKDTWFSCVDGHHSTVFKRRRVKVGDDLSGHSSDPDDSATDGDILGSFKCESTDEDD